VAIVLFQNIPPGIFVYYFQCWESLAQWNGFKSDLFAPQNFQPPYNYIYTINLFTFLLNWLSISSMPSTSIGDLVWLNLHYNKTLSKRTHFLEIFNQHLDWMWSIYKNPVLFTLSHYIVQNQYPTYGYYKNINKCSLSRIKGTNCMFIRSMLQIKPFVRTAFIQIWRSIIF